MGISNMYDERIRRIVLSGDVRDEMAANFLEQITVFERLDTSIPVSVIINTRGGSVHAAFVIYDAMRTCACPIETIGTGKVMSAGVLLLAAGDPGNRYITDHTSIMIHQVSGGVGGTVSLMDATLEEIRRLQSDYIEILAKHTGKDKKTLVKDMAEDKYMTAKQAIEYGIADGLYPHRKLSSPTYEGVKNKKGSRKGK